MRRLLTLVLAGFFTVALYPAVASAADEDMGYKAIKAQDWDRAETELLKDLEANPQDAFRLLNLAYVYQAQGKNDQAIAVYEKIIAMDSNPRAALPSGRGKRVKTIARQALAMLEQN